MSIPISDEFLHTKARVAVDAYFGYLQPAFEMLSNNELEFGSDKERDLLDRYSPQSTEYQVRASSFVLEVFHTLELLFKAALGTHGEYLVYESLEDFLKKRASATAKAKQQQQDLDDLSKNMAAASKKPMHSGSQKLIDRWLKLAMQQAPVQFGHSVSASVAFDRLLYFRQDPFDKELVDRFRRLIESRNQLVHFGDLGELLRGVIDAHACLMGFAAIDQRAFPRFFNIRTACQAHAVAHDNLMEHFMLHDVISRLSGGFFLVAKHLVPNDDQPHADAPPIAEVSDK